MNYHIISLFPHSLDSYLNESIIKRAIEDKKIRVFFYNPRDFSRHKWHRVDQRPYGGGPGMVIEALPVIKAIEKAMSKTKKGKAKIIWLTPSGKNFNTSIAKNIAKKYSDIIIICGRYEGIDARVKKVFKSEDISVGQYVLTGGELPAMLLIDSISRQIKGVLGDFSSLEESRASSADVYTRPEVIEYKGRKLKVPKILLSGNHKLIDEWKENKK